MNVESILPFFLIAAPFAAAFFLEAMVIYFFKIKSFWPAMVVALAVNLLALAVLYGGSLLAGKLGYEFNGLQIPPQVLLFLWWLSVIADGALLQLLATGAKTKIIYTASIVMNMISYTLLYFFIIGGQ